MRVVAMCLALLVVTAGTASAQVQPQVGVKVGPTFASMDFGEDSGYSVRTSLGGGGFLVLRPDRRLALQLEALYRPGGAKATEEIEGIDASSKLLINYFEVPVLARLTLTRSATR